MNYGTNSFKVIKTLGYNCADMVETLRDLDLDIFTTYALNGPLLVNKRLGLFFRVLKGTEKTEYKDAIRDCQNHLTP